MEFIRENELRELISIINSKPYGKYLITGPAGSGKSFFLNMLTLDLEEHGQNIIYEVPRYGVTSEKNIENVPNAIYLFDGLDEAFRQKRVVEEIKKSRNCCICTARENIFDIKFDYELRLKSLSVEQVLLLINNYIKQNPLKEDFIENVFNSIEKNNITPRNILELLYFKMKENGDNELIFNLVEDSYQIYTYGEGVSLQQPKIIIPDRKIIKVPAEIKYDINVVSSSILKQVVSRPEILYEITPRQFEEFVCELFMKRGYNVHLTKQTRDGGKDLIVLNNSLLGDMIIYAECKKYSKNHPVNVGLVRNLYGAVEADKATAGIMITTSYFSKDARKFQESIKSRMSLMDYTELMKNIIEFG